jgi:DNA mismatch endonuclease Vsr
MSRIRGKDTAPELIVRSVLWRAGYRFRVHVKIPIQYGHEFHELTRNLSQKEIKGTKPATRNPKLPIQSGRQEIRKQKPEAGSQKADVRRQTSGLRPLVVCPDIVLPKYKTAIFVHGCYWHRHRGCKNCTTPTHRREWWVQKLEGNAARDKRHQRALRKLGWRVIVIWECKAASAKEIQRILKLFLCA